MDEQRRDHRLLWLVEWTDDRGNRESARVRGGNPEAHRRVAARCGGKDITVRRVKG